MKRKEKIDRIDAAADYADEARSRILPLSYEDEVMGETQGILLEARDALRRWSDELKYRDGSIIITGNEKGYILNRLDRAKEYLEDQLEKYDGKFVEAEDAMELLETAIDELSY